MSDLVEWLTRILNEDEAAAQAAKSPARGALVADSGTWETYHGGGVEDSVSGDVIVYDEGAPTSEQADFIARHDPSAALADIAAKRALIARYVEVNEWVAAGHHDEFASEQIGLETALAIQATAYAGRPGYDESWRP